MRSSLLNRVTNRPVLQWLAPTIILAVAIAVLGWLVLANLYDAYTRDPNAPDVGNPPIYPGAYGLTTRDSNLFTAQAADKGKVYQTDTKDVGKIIDYQANAKPEIVYTFYRKVMPERGWPTPDQLDDGSLDFTYASYRKGLLWPGTMTLFSTTVLAKSSVGGVTYVELETRP